MRTNFSCYRKRYKRHQSAYK